MTVDSLLAALESHPQHAGRLTHVRSFPEQGGIYRKPDQSLPPPLQIHLDRNRISLYSHQTEALEAFRNGENVILTTRTASGKTLAFLLPVLERLLLDPAATALFLYPT
ncbi:MAG: DEAD/DEAH box helicase, partial [Methanoregulaceae archaeon]|nr:DEAD/DEAH box helicase [Methanoregulaceae archaeon]